MISRARNRKSRRQQRRTEHSLRWPSLKFPNSPPSTPQLIRRLSRNPAKTSTFPRSYEKVPFDTPQRYPFCRLRAGDCPVTGKRHRNPRKCTGQTTVSGYSEPIVPASHPSTCSSATPESATGWVSSGFGRRIMARTLIPNAGSCSPRRERSIKNGTKESFRQIGFCGTMSQPFWTLNLRVAR